jgi:cytochrome P450
MFFNTHIDRYQPNVLARRLLEPMAGRGLLLLEGEEWSRQHRQVIPFFQPRHIERLIPVFHNTAAVAIDRWSSVGANERNLLADLRRLALDIIARSLLSIEDEKGIAQLADFVAEAERSGALLQWQDFVATAVGIRMPQPRRRLDFAARFRVWVKALLDRRQPICDRDQSQRYARRPQGGATMRRPSRAGQRGDRRSGRHDVHRRLYHHSCRNVLDRPRAGSAARMAFGSGPRGCIGAAFATTEILVVLRRLLSRCKIELRGQAPRPVGRVTLVPEFQPLFRLTPLK